MELLRASNEVYFQPQTLINLYVFGTPWFAEKSYDPKDPTDPMNLLKVWGIEYVPAEPTWATAVPKLPAIGFMVPTLPNETALTFTPVSSKPDRWFAVVIGADRRFLPRFRELRAAVLIPAYSARHRIALNEHFQLHITPEDGRLVLLVSPRVNHDRLAKALCMLDVVLNRETIDMRLTHVDFSKVDSRLIPVQKNHLPPVPAFWQELCPHLRHKLRPIGGIPRAIYKYMEAHYPDNGFSRQGLLMRLFSAGYTVPHELIEWYLSPTSTMVDLMHLVVKLSGGSKQYVYPV